MAVNENRQIIEWHSNTFTRIAFTFASLQVRILKRYFTQCEQVMIKATLIIKNEFMRQIQNLQENFNLKICFNSNLSIMHHCLTFACIENYTFFVIKVLGLHLLPITSQLNYCTKIA